MEQSYKWVLKCIASCKNEFQLDCCRELLRLFQEKYSLLSGMPEYIEMEGKLIEAIHNQDVFQSVDA